MLDRLARIADINPSMYGALTTTGTTTTTTRKGP